LSHAISFDPTEVLTHDDGSAFPIAFVATDGAAVFADSLGEVVNQIIDGYDALPEATLSSDERLEARIDSLAQFAGSGQAVILAALTESGELSIDDVDEDTLTALFAEKDGVVLEFDEWESDIPLLLLTRSYVPYTDVPSPAGERIVWLDARNERTYLEALELLGVGEVMVSE